MNKYLFYFFLGTVSAATIGIIVSFFNFVWIADNVETWGYILLTAFFVAAITFPILIFLTKIYFRKFIEQIERGVESNKKEILDKTNNLSSSITETLIESSFGLIEKLSDYFVKRSINSLIVRVYIWIFVAILGSVGSVLLFNQNQLIKEQNTMLLKQYEGFINQTQFQVERWAELDRIDFEGEKKLLETEILSLQRETYAFSIDMASLEKILDTHDSDENTIANRIWDWWELTMDDINADLITNKLELAEARLNIERYKFFFSPVDNRLKVMRSYPKEQQKDIVIAMREMLQSSIDDIKINKSVEEK